MPHQIAQQIHYFGKEGYPITVKRVKTSSKYRHSHQNDLTNIEHSHDFTELVIVSAGQAIHSLESNEFPVFRGDVFLVQGKQRHFFHSCENLELINIMYDSENIALSERDLRRMPGYCAIFMFEPIMREEHKFTSRLHLSSLRLTHAERLAEEMEKERHEQKDGYEITLHIKLLELITYLSRSYGDNETIQAHALTRIGQLIGTLEKDYSKNWKIIDMEKLSNMSRSNLNRVFRQATGQSPIEYLMHFRIQKAMKLLRNSDYNITEIALSTGFNDSNYFTRCFRKANNLTPRQYRKL